LLKLHIAQLQPAVPNVAKPHPKELSKENSGLKKSTTKKTNAIPDGNFGENISDSQNV